MERRYNRHPKAWAEARAEHRKPPDPRVHAPRQSDNAPVIRACLVLRKPIQGIEPGEVALLPAGQAQRLQNSGLVEVLDEQQDSSADETGHSPQERE